jgi:histidinol-phosphate/aromatic aminotransferase/cobyric acid decarboxylase-like protein/N-acyl-L-homoserine lactone synthetase
MAKPFRLTISVASEAEREAIYRFRHDVYARELAQHGVNSTGFLRDGLDAYNVYLVTKSRGEITGFISITPPTGAKYSLDKYFARDQLPFPFDERLYEVRLLTVVKPQRGGKAAALLMYAALRWVEAHGGTRVVVIGRRELRNMYLRSGLKPVGLTTKAGAIVYEVMTETTETCRRQMAVFSKMIGQLARQTDWQLNFPFHLPTACLHGGTFFAAVGVKFDTLDRASRIINADVLDAWFPPAPGVLKVLSEHLPWLLRTSPPTGCEGLVETIAKYRDVGRDNILPGAGSSDLIFRALRQWMTPASRALLLDPTYGEYVHVLERVVGCAIDRLTVHRESSYDLDLARLETAFADDYDLVVLVNPNSPTGRYVPRQDLEAVLRRAPAHTRLWIDEAYVEYTGHDQSLEAFACRSENVVVCKSMSKVYALSGARVAYLCAGRHQLEELRAITPPWVVSLPAQVAAVEALKDPGYYAARYAETAVLRERLATALRALRLDVVSGIANFILCHVPPVGADAAAVVERCRTRGLFIRDAAQMGMRLGGRALRIAVKDEATTAKMVDILAEALGVRHSSPGPT